MRKRYPRRTFWDTAQGKKIIASGLFMACFMLLGSPTYALTIDAQAVSSCTGYSCITKVDMSKYMTSPELTSAKASDISKNLPSTQSKDMSSGITDISYKWDKDFIVITGTITKNTYWTLDVNGYVIDPWWNYTIAATNYTQNISLNVNGGAGTDKQCELITMATDAYLVSFAKHVSDGSTKGYVYSNTGTHIKNVSMTGDLAIFSPFLNLTSGSSYYLCVWSDGASRNQYIRTPGGYPINSRDYTVITGSYFDSTWHNDTLYRGVFNITTQSMAVNVNYYYTANMYLNGNETNITLANTTALNITALTNVSTFNVSIYKNGTLVNSSLGSASSINYLPSGLYNITAWIGNASTNTTITYWANMTYAAPPGTLTYVLNVDPNNAPLICVDNSTALRYTVINGQSFNETYTCPYGCENNACKLEPIYQGFLSFGILVGFIVILLLLGKVLKR